MKIFCILLNLLFLSNSFAHEGEKDKNGCHFLRVNKKYHCHDLKVYKNRPKKDYTKTKYTPCHSNLLDCSHFGSQHESQMAFEHCGGSKNDIHYLDPDQNGIACENLK